MEELESPAFSSVVRRSIQLSYTRKYWLVPAEGFKPPTTRFRRPTLYSLSYAGKKRGALPLSYRRAMALDPTEI